MPPKPKPLSPVVIGLGKLKHHRLPLEYDFSRDEYFIRGRTDTGTPFEYRNCDPVQVLVEFGDNE